MKQWELKEIAGHAIADTGDYSDPMYMLTNGDIELVTKDDMDPEDCDSISLVSMLNAIDANWEDWKLSNAEFELHLEKENCRKWKEVAGKLNWALTYIRTYASYPVATNVMKEYEELLNNLP